MSKITEIITKIPKWLKITLISVAGVLVLSLIGVGISAGVKAAKLNEQLKCEHEYSQGEETKAAQCEEDGVRTFTCKKCDKTKTEPITKLGHKTKIIQGYAATCAEEGRTEGTTCVVCGKEVTMQKPIPALGHNVVIDAGKNATCLESGLMEGQHCKRCNEVLIKQEVVPAKGHNVVTVYGYEATCIETGLTDGTKCANCETVYSKQVMIDALGHKPVTHTGKTATCLEKGWNSYVTCERATCGYTTYEEIPALGHNFSNAICLRCGYQLPEGHECIYTMEEVTQATCEVDGQKVKKCICGKVETETIKAYGHAWNSGIVTQAPLCGVDGERAYTCSNCGVTKTEKINKIEHEFTETRLQNLTCLTDGIVRYDCVNCDYSYTNTTEANGHDNDEGVITIAATCTKAGEKVYACKTCGAITKQTLSKLSHTVVVLEYIAPTCTTMGKTVGSYCSACGGILTEQKDIPSLGHNFGDWIKVSQLTCVTDGVEKRTCTICSKTETSKIEATGHNYTDGACTACDGTMLLTGLAMTSNTSVSSSLSRPRLEFSFTVEKAVADGLSAKEEIGAIIVDLDSFYAVSTNMYVDWVKALNAKQMSYTYKKASIVGTTGTVMTAGISYASMNTKYGAIPCVKTTLDNGEISYQYASNVFGTFSGYARSVSYVVGTELSNNTLNERLGEETLDNATKEKYLSYLDESIDLANGLLAPEYNGNEPTLVLKLNGVEKDPTQTVTMTVGRKYKLTFKSLEGITFQIAGKYDTSMFTITSNGVDTLEITPTKAGTTNVMIGFANQEVLLTLQLQ